MFNKTFNVTVKGDAEAAAEVLNKWTKDHDRSFNGFFTAILPAIAFCIQNYTKVDTEGKITVELNLGTITIPPKGPIHWTQRPPH